ncbi:unnamed protein product [Aphanomyces euteiches]
MSMQLQLSQEQQLKLAMTPELKQSIHILQLSSYELARYLQEQALENPVLDIQELPEPFAKIRKSSSYSNQDVDPLWRLCAEGETLEEWLGSQLRISGVEVLLYKIALFMAGNLLDNGYLAMSLTQISTALNQPIHTVEAALQALQSLDPPGVGARDLRECLLLQIHRETATPVGAYEMVRDHMQLIAQGKLKEIADKLKISLEQVKTGLRYIRSLNPRPGLEFCPTERQHYIVPDALIRKEEYGFVVHMNASNLPKLSVNMGYAKFAKEMQDQHAYDLREKVKSASWIVRSLNQRMLTLTRVIQVLAAEQLDFLEHGPGVLKPLNLKAIAEKLELHESTISRTVQNKYVQTPFGVFELKYFFSASLQTTDGSCTSIKNVKLRIKQLIAEENKKQPYSDQKMVDLLMAEGIRISRRTVTKYREELNILSSVIRKSIV